ncbi:hypothetical protein GGS20DRAFT_536429 [Poronia punctata]|nr:hypothetical protein GGS20DRAFT_536429 [Poronia punctata]
MATEESANVVPGHPRQQQSPTPGPAGEEPSEKVEFRGYDFFSQQEYNRYKEAARAYFGAANKNNDPSSWLGDATPPQRSLEQPRPGDRAWSNTPDSEPTSTSGRRILGLPSQWFWTLLTTIILVLIVVIGVGVGVGTSQGRGSSGSKNAQNSDGVTSSIISTTSSHTRTTTATSSAASTSTHMPAPTAEVDTGCPAVNGTTYRVPGSTKRFLRLCGVDYGEGDGAIDITNIPTVNVTDCIDNCAGTPGCVGCGWGFIKGDKGPEHRCWLKSDLKKSHDANPNWAFALLL